MNIKEEILERTNRGVEVFCFYMPIDFVPKWNFRNPLYEGKRASCNIFFDTKAQCYRMKDFGNDAYSGDCFWFAATILGLDARTDFMKVLATIIHDLNLNISFENKGSWGTEIGVTKRPTTPLVVHKKSKPKHKWLA
ncbi:hypothetical protein HMPREF1199_00360 [Hoylesella oralis CC98A]|nr:hypothetical protein HMPREF1199_00360 [Hoylesella oralis CC98A]